MKTNSVQLMINPHKRQEVTILSPYFSTNMQKAELNEDDAGIRMGGSKYNLRYDHDTSLMSESAEDLKGIMKLTEQSKPF